MTTTSKSKLDHLVKNGTLRKYSYKTSKYDPYEPTHQTLILVFTNGKRLKIESDFITCYGYDVATQLNIK